MPSQRGFKEGNRAAPRGGGRGACQRRLLAETYADEVAGLELARININAVDASGNELVNGAGGGQK